MTPLSDQSAFDGSDDEQDCYVDKTDAEANRERQADVRAANAEREARMARAAARRRAFDDFGGDCFKPPGS